MRTRTAAAVSVLTLTPGLAACGGDASAPAEQEAASSTPASTDVTVNLSDPPPQSILFNGGGGFCLSYDYVQAIQDSIDNGGKPSTADRAEVTLRNADGTIVAVRRLSKRGGSWSDGCAWDVTFEKVPASDFYEATITDRDDEAVGRAEATPDEAMIVRVTM